MKRHVLILPRWYPNKADIQLGNFIRQQAILLKDVFAVSVIYVQADPDLRTAFEVIESNSVGVHEVIVYFKSGNGVFGKIMNARRYKKAQQLGFERIKTKVDLCHVHVPYRSAFLALKLKRQHHIPFVITEHWSGHLTGDYQQKNTADKSLYKSVLKKAAALSCVSRLLAEKFKTNTGFDAEVIPNYIEHIAALPVHTNREKIHLLSVSDMTDEIKNISGLLNSFFDAVQKNPKLHLTLIGGGPDEEKIKNLIHTLKLEASVSFQGRLAHNLVLKAMQNCDFYVCNSNFETFGMTVAEAISAGKPVVCTRCGGPEEFLHKNNSLLIDRKNKQQLTSAILSMSKEFQTFDPQKLSTEMDQKFGKEAVRKMWVNFYDSVLENR